LNRQFGTQTHFHHASAAQHSPVKQLLPDVAATATLGINVAAVVNSAVAIMTIATALDSFALRPVLVIIVHLLSDG
jgi:CBS domain containing-hemolysin-like protein